MVIFILHFCRRLSRVLCGAALSLWVFGGEGALRAEVPEIFPIAEIKEGMKGTWRTVVRGTEIEEFELKILGVMPNGLGPGRDSILAYALDDRNRLSGPVAGMSGSPVFIDGRLVGAYAYGYAWSKQQAIIGVTPIEQMLELLDFPLEPPPLLEGQATPWAAFGERSVAMPAAMEGPMLRPLPAPLALSGFSNETIRAFADDWSALGFDIVQGASGGSVDAVKSDFAPGSAVAAVLMSGDFSAASTGTVTWTDGERVIGFGHPFRQWGAVAVPMAAAEIVAVMQSAQLSFKLSRVGPVVGSIFQDRLPGIAGRVGPVPDMVPVTISTSGASPDARFEGRAFDHPATLPMMVAMATFQAATRSMEAGVEQTVRLSGSIRFAGQEPILVDDVGTGSLAVLGLAFTLRDQLSRVMNHPAQTLRLESVDLHIESFDARAQTRLIEVRLLQERVTRRGGEVSFAVVTERFRGDRHTETVTLPLPDEVRPGDRLTLLVTDAARADAAVGDAQGRADSPVAVLAQWRNRRAADAMYVLLIRSSEGVTVGDVSLRDVPPSVLASLTSDTRFAARDMLRERVISEQARPTVGPFSGNFRLTFRID